MAEAPLAAALPPLNLVEPAAEPSRRRAAGALAGRRNRSDLAALREQVKAVRESARRTQGALVRELQETLRGYPALRLWFAGDAPQAVARIAEIAGPLRLLSLNKSSVVLNELAPGLQREGFETYVRYFGEFPAFDGRGFESRVEDYWSLPGLHGRQLVESFAVRNGAREFPRGDTRAYVAVLGVNALAAGDGSVFFLQHMGNIAKDLEQAQKVVLVAALEKVTKDRVAALCQTEAMGVYGLESLLLDLGPDERRRFDFDALPVLAGAPEREVHLVLLDNGRLRLLDTAYRDLFLCVDCRACARQCPVGRHLPPGRGLVYSPKNYLFGFLQGTLPPVQECLHCGRCAVECPLDIDLPRLIWEAQRGSHAKHRRGLRKRMLDDPESLAKIGSLAAPLSTWALGLASVRGLVQAVAGVDRRARLPSFRRDRFRQPAEGSPRA